MTGTEPPVQTPAQFWQRLGDRVPDPCTVRQSSPDVVARIVGGCLVKSFEPRDPDGYLISVAITGKPAVTIQYQGPPGQEVSAVSRRLEIAALAIGKELER